MKRKIMKLAVLMLALACLLLAGCRKQPAETTGPDAVSTGDTHATETEPADKPEEPLMPWEAEGAKSPETYTLAEYESLTPEQRKEFLSHLGAAGYAEWLEWAQAQEEEDLGNPWEVPGADQPMDYTWEQYQALTEKQKKAFMEALGPGGLEAWLKKQQAEKTENPWEKPGAKQPINYTWAEYQALTSEQRAAFARYLGASRYKTWLENVKGYQSSGGSQQKNPWEVPGAKQPEDYTWEEYEMLTSAQQKAFRKYLGSDAFEAWLEKAQEKDPWEEDGAKQPEDYTWEEYQALTEEQKVAFQEYLGAREYEAWLENVLGQNADSPWKKPGAKQPKDYTWTDYAALTESQQASFRLYLGENGTKAWLRKITEIPWEEPKAKQPEDYTLEEYEDLEDPQQLAFKVWMGEEEFEEWLIEMENPTDPNPWETPGAKQPKDYTWEEFEALTPDQQMAFQQYLGEKGFQNWLDKIQVGDIKVPWEKPGAKQPKDYTLEEYEALTADQQMAFQQYLGAKGFEAWLSQFQEETDPGTVTNPWEKPGAKQPKDYTWAEFEALTAEQQIAFQKHLGSDGFEAWLSKVQNQNETQPDKMPWEVPGAKQPKDYTWAEFEALTGEQQMAFQKYLGNDGFEAWLSKVQNQNETQPNKMPWEVPGAKQPQDYTWAEFEALTGEQQIAFQTYLGQAAFEAWLNRVLGE